VLLHQWPLAVRLQLKDCNGGQLGGFLGGSPHVPKEKGHGFGEWWRATGAGPCLLHIPSSKHAATQRLVFGCVRMQVTPAYQLVGAALVLSVSTAFTFLAGCAIGGNPAVLFADPAKYQFSSCEQLAKHRKELSTREQELRQLMDRAEQGTGGALVNVLAYKGDYIAATEELSLIDSTATSKKCDTPANWPSNSAVR